MKRGAVESRPAGGVLCGRLLPRFPVERGAERVKRRRNQPASAASVLVLRIGTSK